MEYAPDLPPCIQFEDEHLLVVHKPAGWNTHAPAPFAGEGIYEWLRHREARWAELSTLHRLDKDTSGLLVFGKSAEANRSLTRQFTDRTLTKRYRLLVRQKPSSQEWVAASHLVRVGDGYRSRPAGNEGEASETTFRVVRQLEAEFGPVWELEATPKTGRTHQIRVHAADAGCPILGDTLYGGTPFRRVCLHAAELAFEHPVSHAACRFECPLDLFQEPRALLRSSIIDPRFTTAFRRLHGAADGFAGNYLDQLGDYALLQSNLGDPGLMEWAGEPTLYFKHLRRDVRATPPAETSPQWIRGPKAPERFVALENQIRFEFSLAEGYSTGLFLDQRDNRRRLLTNHIAGAFPIVAGSKDLTGIEVLNAFAYTCGFSVCAARAGARTTSLDLSRKYLDWGRRNFVHNDLDPMGHDFIFGDCFDWMKRLVRKGRTYDLVLLDPPTFSRSREHGDFRAERDFGRLVQAALALLKTGGILFASTNALRLTPEDFLAQIRTAIHQGARRILREHYVPQPPDFPINRQEPAHLKTVWMRIQ